MMPRIVVIGSCVTRDPLSYLKDEVDIVWYQARTCVASMMADPCSLDLDYETSSMANFEKRNVQYDLNKQWKEKVKTDHDVTVFDFIDERFGLCLAGEKVFTYSTALRGVAGDKVRSLYERYLNPLSDGYLQALTAALPAFCEVVSSLPNVVVNDAHWTPRIEGNGAFTADVAEKIDQYNRVLDLIYGALASRTKARFVGLPLSETLAKRGHRWGDTPYHYSDETERLIADRLRIAFGATAEA